MSEAVRLTQFSHGAGCGCKIAPAVLEKILHFAPCDFFDPCLLVGNETRDDAAVYDLGNGQCVVSTTDFFMPIVDDPADFGRIAATNAMSDVYAMGGRPVMALAILGWPVNQLAPEVAGQVVAGARAACQQAGIALAGGHSIDCVEPIFGLAVSGLVEKAFIKRNSSARAGCRLYLTKPLGIGVLSTAEKKGLLHQAHRDAVVATMCTLNQAGSAFARLECVRAMTDVTGFGLGGHLLEMCQSAGLRAVVSYQSLPLLPEVESYIAKGCVPGGSGRNFASYGQALSPLPDLWRDLICDPQTSGGLLLAVDPDETAALAAVAAQSGTPIVEIGRLYPAQSGVATVTVV